MDDPIVGKVIRILDKYEIIIDKGRNDGVKEGDYFIIYDEGEEILDLEGESLGKLEIIKGSVEVEQTHENFSICKVYQTKITQSPLYTSVFAGLASQREFMAHEELIPLDINTDDLDRLDMEITKVKKGDLVKQDLD